MAKTRQQIAGHLGISVTTLWRLLKKSNISLPPGLVYPRDEANIYHLLGHGSDPSVTEVKRNELF